MADKSVPFPPAKKHWHAIIWTENVKTQDYNDTDIEEMCRGLKSHGAGKGPVAGS